MGTNPTQSGPRTKSFDNPSASSTASSGVGTSISSLNTTNTNLANSVNSSAPATPNVVKKYYEQKYGSTTNMASGGNVGGALHQDKNNNAAKNGSPRTGSGLFNQAFGQSGLLSGLANTVNGNNNNNTNNNQNPMQNNQNINNNPQTSPLGAGFSSLTSQFTSGFANLKLTASNFQANKLSSVIKNPFSS